MSGKVRGDPRPAAERRQPATLATNAFPLQFPLLFGGLDPNRSAPMASAQTKRV